MKFIVILALVMCIPVSIIAQGNIHQQSTVYVWPKDPLVVKNLEQWRNQKFGMIIHWGVYAVPGMIESWALCSEDWITRDSTVAYEDFKKWYWGLSEKFNPTKFDPDQWASAAKSAGMRYVVFTTKHHDGFSMFDTNYSDYKITNGPFSNHPKSNVAKFVFDAFRKQGFKIGAYYSKPDWHSEYFWWPNYATPDRNVNYDIRKNPWRWNKFKEFTHHQINELMTEYGKIDILWLDGGWIRPLETVTDEVRAWGAAIPEFSQHIEMDKIAEFSRKAQPGLLIVDRTVHGEYENYQTPEQRIPDHKLDTPWESCITLGDTWGYSPQENFKSSATVIHLLVEVVAKGGSLLLGVGPTPEGLLQPAQVERLKEIGMWLDKNGKAIYDTRTVDLYMDGNTYFTGNTDSTINAIVLFKQDASIPAKVEWRGNLPTGKLIMVETGEAVKYSIKGDKVMVVLPSGLVKTSKSPAVAFRYLSK
ncbi:MAG: alpha-L-fucosidase [Chryseolinea sp.]